MRSSSQKKDKIKSLTHIVGHVTLNRLLKKTSDDNSIHPNINSMLGIRSLGP
jgi:hypothetical protein